MDAIRCIRHLANSVTGRWAKFFYEPAMYDALAVMIVFYGESCNLTTFLNQDAKASSLLGIYIPRCTQY